MITVTVSGEQGCGKSMFVEWLTKKLKERSNELKKAVGVTPWGVKEIIEVSEEEGQYLPFAKHLHECVKTGTCYAKVNGAEHTVLSWETQIDQNGNRHLALHTETRDQELDRIVSHPSGSNNERSWPHYFKRVPDGVTHVDVYWVLEAWAVSHPIGHAIKKLLCAGARGSKDRVKDLNEAIASIRRALELEQFELAKHRSHIRVGWLWVALVCGITWWCCRG